MHFLVIFGPPAVGKMSVGRNIERATGIRLFHNHMTIEPVLNFFEFGTPPFHRLVDGFRRRIFEEVAQSDLPGLSFTFVWNLDSAEDHDFIAAACEPFRARGANVALIELRAGLATRLARNRSPERLQEKRFGRDVLSVRPNRGRIARIGIDHTETCRDVGIEQTNLFAPE